MDMMQPFKREVVLSAPDTYFAACMTPASVKWMLK